MLKNPSSLIISHKAVRIKNWCQSQETEASMKKVKEYLRNIYESMINADPRMKSCILYYDVDPS